MQPVIDPAGWYPEDLATDDSWIYELSTQETNEVRDAVTAIEERGLDILDIRGEDVKMPDLDRSLGMLYDELLNGRGFFLLRGVPVGDFNNVQAAAAY